MEHNRQTSHPETVSLHAGHQPDAETGSRVVPLYQTTSYLFRDAAHAADLFSLNELGNIYTRLQNPTTDVVEKRLAALEGGTGGLLTSSGMAAIFLAIHNLAACGDHIVSSSAVYGGTHTMFKYTLERMGISTTFIDDPAPAAVEAALQDNTKAVYFETIGNPTGAVLDMKGVADVAHKHGVPVVVDNTFAPLLCRPFDYGADIVVHSCTKWIGGHGTSIGGVVIDGGRFDWSSGRFPDFTTPDPSYHGISYWDTFKEFPDLGNVAYIMKARLQGMRNIGPCPSPFNAFLFLQGIETLPLRMKKQCENAAELARWLSEHDKVEWVAYPGLPDHPDFSFAQRYLNGGFGGIIGIGVNGGLEGGTTVINSLKLASHLANVGDAKTLVLHPASTSHQQMSTEERRQAGIEDSFIRISVGLEHMDDIKADFDQALARI